MNEQGSNGKRSRSLTSNLVGVITASILNSKLPAKPSTNIPPANTCLSLLLEKLAHSWKYGDLARICDAGSSTPMNPP